MKDAELVPACLCSEVLKMGSFIILGSQGIREPQGGQAGRGQSSGPRRVPSIGDSAFANDGSSHFTPQEQQVVDRKGRE